MCKPGDRSWVREGTVVLSNKLAGAVLAVKSSMPQKSLSSPASHLQAALRHGQADD